VKRTNAAVGDVSVIIPVYNAAPWLDEALESVLGQSAPPCQVIVVDDGSTDHSAAIAQRYLPQIQLVQQPNAGCAHARNRGVALATGDYLAFLDADDYWTREKLALQLAAFAQNPALEAVLGQVKQTCTITTAQPDAIGFGMDAQDGYNLNTLLIRQQAFHRIGGFDPTIPLTNAVEWLWRARRLGLVSQMLPETLAWRRIHGANMSIQQRPQAQAEYFRLIRTIRSRDRVAR
jgi:glycosyltransferase involved in cell wall biosynthesis